LKFLHAFEGNNFRNQEIYFVVLWRYLHSTLTMYVTHPSAKYFETARCNKLQSCMVFTEKIVVAKFFAKIMHCGKVMHFIC